MLAVVALLTGSYGCGRYDGRLVQADSLMWADADSALAIVVGIGDSTLRGEHDRAYRDLLLTQARYKAYQPITARDDSTITRAMNWYRRHNGEREKLTRATLYKGAVMEELGRVDSAMIYYKTAEAAADSTDYANLGQINTRIGYLYRIVYADEQTCFEKYLLAYQYYEKCGNKEYLLNSLYNLILANSIIKQTDHEALYKKATTLAREQRDNHMLFDLYELRCRQLSRVDSTLSQAKKTGLYCLNNFGQYINNELLIDLAYIYTIENKLDSAKYFITMVDESLNPADKQLITARKLEVLSMIAKAEGNPFISSLHHVESENLSDTLLENEEKYDVIRIENDFNKRRQISFLSKVSSLHKTIQQLSQYVIVLIVALFILHLWRLRHAYAIIRKLDNTNHNALDRTQALLDQLDARKTSVGHLVSNLVTILKSCVSESDKRLSTTEFARQVQENITAVADDGFWKELKVYLDHEHNNVISTIEAENPDVTDKDLRFIELSCLGFSYLEMAMILNYSPRYILNKRKIIAKRLGLQKPLLDYLNDLMTNKQE